MNEVNRIINECGLSKVSVAKYLGVSRQMLYNYLALKSVDELPKEKKSKLLDLFGVSNEKEISKIKINSDFISIIENKLNENDIEVHIKDNNDDLRGLGKREQELIKDLFDIIKERMISYGSNEDGYQTLKYLYHYLQAMEQMDELKYILTYVAKANGLTPALEFVYDESKQYTFEGILFSAMSLYNSTLNGNGAVKAKVTESHKKFELEIESKKEEKLSRTQELNTCKVQALNELGYTTINESNAKEVFEKIAEIMSRKL